MLEMLIIDPPSPATMRAPTSALESERALQVHGDDLVEEILAGLDERRVHGRRSGVVDEDVDAPELLVRGFGEPLQVIPTPDVTGDGQRMPTSRLTNLVGHVGASLDAAARDDDIGAVTREGEHHLATQTTAAAGDQCDLAGEIDVHHRPPLSARMRRARLASIPTLSPRVAMRSSVLSPRTYR